MNNLSGWVYVMSVRGEPTLCKVGRAMRGAASRWGPRGNKYHGYRLDLLHEHKFEDCARAESEIHSLLAWCRQGRHEIFEIEPAGAWGAVLWYAGAEVIDPPQPRRELRLYRTFVKHAADCEKYGVSVYPQ